DIATNPGRSVANRRSRRAHLGRGAGLHRRDRPALRARSEITCSLGAELRATASASSHAPIDLWLVQLGLHLEPDLEPATPIVGLVFTLTAGAPDHRGYLYPRPGHGSRIQHNVTYRRFSRIPLK